MINFKHERVALDYEGVTFLKPTQAQVYILSLLLQPTCANTDHYCTWGIRYILIIIKKTINREEKLNYHYHLLKYCLLMEVL